MASGAHSHHKHAHSDHPMAPLSDQKPHSHSHDHKSHTHSHNHSHTNTPSHSHGSTHSHSHSHGSTESHIHSHGSTHIHSHSLRNSPAPVLEPVTPSQKPQLPKSPLGQASPQYYGGIQSPNTTPGATIGGVTTPTVPRQSIHEAQTPTMSYPANESPFSGFSQSSDFSAQTPDSNTPSVSFSSGNNQQASKSRGLITPNVTPQSNHWTPDWQSEHQASHSNTPPISRSNDHVFGFASEERRRSWSAGHASRSLGTPDSHSISLFDDFNNSVRKTKSSLGFQGTPSKFGGGPMVGRVISLMNSVRFRGRDTGRLAILIALNIAYSTTELVFGLFTGKIELVSDSFHLSFGCCVLILSLTAMIWGRKKADDHFTYGYGRLEIMAAFTNALFLLFLSFSLSVEALHAYIEDESEHKHYLVMSAVANLLVNLLGVLFFRRYARVNMQYKRPQDMNHHAIFLHLLSDSIRSAGVILTSWFLAMGIYSAESICLGLVAGIVLFITLPMLRASGGLLLQMAPAGISEDALHKCIRQAAAYEGVVECFEVRFWAMVPGAIVGTLNMRVSRDADEQRILKHVHSVFNDIGVTDLTVQIEQI